MNRKIAIIECDDLGATLARLWMRQGDTVTVTTQDPQKIEAFSKIAQKSLVLKSDDEEEWIWLIENHDILIIMMVEADAEQADSIYLQTALTLRRLALTINAPRRLIFISNTKVYGDHHGKWVDETSERLAKAPHLKALIHVESIYQSLAEIGWSVTILRFSDIYGINYSLAKRLEEIKGQSLPGSGDYYTNMVHEEDCVRAIDYVLQRDLEGVFNIADDDHPIFR